MKVFYIVPYLSTGGMPEYLKNKIEKIKDEAEVWVFEKRHEKVYNTIRKRIESIIGDDRIVVWGDLPEQKLLGAIREMKPDVIHFEEPCEHFVSEKILEEIFREDREYKIFETMHDSSVSSKEIVYLPDKFIVVSPWQVNLLQDLGVPIEVVEHEISSKPNPDYLGSRKKLEFDQDKKHVVQIGIFTPRKNQRETVEIARLIPEVQFHFVGTLAENFKWYWEPILNSLPANCKIWGERDDVDLFYQASDLVIFPSIALFNDKETSPLVIKEAISWKSHLLLRDLPVYMDMYQESDKITFFKGQSNSETAKQIRDVLSVSKTEIKNKNNNMFIHRFLPDKNCIDIVYIGDEKNIPYIDCDVYIRDIDSEANIFHFKCGFELGVSYWAIPIPKHIYEFFENPNFGGFLIEYVSNGELISQNRIRFRNTNKRKCRLKTNDPIFRNYEEFFTDGLYDSLIEGIINKEVFVDIGANVGLFTEYCLDRGFKRALCAEPNPGAAREFRSMHLENPNVNLQEIAVTGDGLDIKLSFDPHNTLISSVSKNVGQNEILVKSKTLGDFISELEFIDLLKIDIEGAEYDLISKTPNEVLSKVGRIIMEFHDNYDRRVIQLTSKLESAGFQCRILDEKAKRDADLSEDHGVIFAKRI